MSSNGQRESRNGGGDLQYESQTVTGTKGNEWFVIWERGNDDTRLGIRTDAGVVRDLGDMA